MPENIKGKRKMKNKLEKICRWKIITLKIPYPEGRLKYCKYECSGYDNECKGYTPKIER